MAIVLARVGMEYWRKPPSGYVCHGCNVPRHFIQHCPTNGDPNYDIKKVKPPRSSVGVLKTNEAAFLKEGHNKQNLGFGTNSSSEHGVSAHNPPAKIPFPSESVSSLPP
ncbi:E3 ubiquitin-protein ligase rbbp6 [Datura stramonium]|uniref:E3 ubiquitin-protein ligase rbbp6 n=1 Tax=Datura stramonium TaxID=4076 RepID=A0ABS8UJJ6_DATST|nr:E3 ubiquitin-protein ligase rbbp6 [Datura stramonium]